MTLNVKFFLILKRGIYFCTIKEKDGDNDKASNLHRYAVFRVNFGIDFHFKPFNVVLGRYTKIIA